MSNGIHDEVRDMLKNSAIDLGEPGFDSTFGYAVWLAPAHCISATAKAKINGTDHKVTERSLGFASATALLPGDLQDIS